MKKTGRFTQLFCWTTMAVAVAGCTPLRHERGNATRAEQIAPDKSKLATGVHLVSFDSIDAQDVATLAPDPHRSTLDMSMTTGPLSLSQSERQAWLITPEECIQIAIERSKVLKDLGGTFLNATDGIRTIHDPAISITDPRFGIEAALSAFDAQLTSKLYSENNDYAINNRLLGGGTNVIGQDLLNVQNELSKKTATGTQFFFRHNTGYDANNAPGNLFTSAWTTNLEAGFRHPLGQGRGVDFNRIAGPNATPGTYNGVLIARAAADANIVDFEFGLLELINDVENAYWDLYFAYRNLESKISARDAALNTWRETQSLQQLPGGAADKEAQSREQYFRFQTEVQEALTGRIVDGTRSYNGSNGGSFRGTLGVHVAERRLRLLMNLPINDEMMLRPAKDPTIIRVVFDWNSIALESMVKRPELRKQWLVIRRREMELIASRNHLLPQLDAITRYRVRGFGHDLLSPDDNQQARFDNAWASLTSGEFQEWQFGLEMKTPIGFRQAHAGMRNAQLLLARERDILDRKQQRILHDLSNAYADTERAFALAEVAYNRREAAQTQLTILRQRESLGSRVDLNGMLDAQNRAADADAQYFSALSQYMLSLKNVHFEKGSLLDYNNIVLEDRGWPSAAYCPTPCFPKLRQLGYAFTRRRASSSPPSPNSILSSPSASEQSIPIDPSEPLRDDAPPTAPDTLEEIPATIVTQPDKNFQGPYDLPSATRIRWEVLEAPAFLPTMDDSPFTP